MTPSQLVRLRQSISDSATALARTEDQVASTMEHGAQARPAAAPRLLAEAGKARRYAAYLRDQADRYRTAQPTTVTGIGGGHGDSDYSE